MWHKYLFTISLLLCGIMLAGQGSNSLVREGNKAYDAGKFDQAEGDYGKAISRDSSNIKAWFNLGAAQYEQKKFDKATIQFNESVKALKDPKQKADAWYNMGNGLYKQDKMEESINAYKEALRLNPAHSSARYNLVMAKKKLQQEQQEQQNKGGNNNDNPQKNDEKGKEEKNQQDAPQPDQQKQQEQPKPSQGDKQLEQLLKAIDQEESKVQQKLYNKGEGKAPEKKGKDW